ncbi:oxysterol-binding protein [Kipferlia bialata]|uniref:Oxysterol-binding protein n=1 Tax=Kipferlia bialata TaxID=797122 RepID=A0A9K3GF00_9EUKA|nr:oxysterol-binding protein [Kipferlia bialata]|eukprot:g1066.t1
MMETPLLAAARRQTDPLVRFVHVCAFFFAGLSRLGSHRKPVNPVLGETYETVFGDGTRVYCEGSRHHPPETSMLLLGDGWRLSGQAVYTASFKGNTVNVTQPGKWLLVLYDNTGVETNRIHFTLPDTIINGIIWGKRAAVYTGTFLVYDETSHLEGTIHFTDSRKKGRRVDECDMSIVQVTDTEKRAKWHSKKRDKKDHPKYGSEISTAQGSYVKEFVWQNQVIWRYSHSIQANSPVPLERALPSDSRRRADVRLIGDGDFPAAQKAKETIEEAQRRDRRLRAGESK